jgi:hypothetical protein
MNREGQAPLLPTRVLVVALCLAAFAIALFIISTTALAQNSSAGDLQSENTIIDKKIIPANYTTVKTNVTVIPITNNTSNK